MFRMNTSTTPKTGGARTRARAACAVILGVALCGVLPASASALPAVAVDGSNTLLKFDTATPGTVTPVVIGVPSGEIVSAIDVRPADGLLYGVTAVAGSRAAALSHRSRDRRRDARRTAGVGAPRGHGSHRPGLQPVRRPPALRQHQRPEPAPAPRHRSAGADRRQHQPGHGGHHRGRLRPQLRRHHADDPVRDQPGDELARPDRRGERDTEPEHRHGDRSRPARIHPGRRG